jgi:hypothetical protein
MSVIGAPTNWADLIDDMVPVILELVLESWPRVTAFAPDEREDPITDDLCRALRKNKKARSLPFNIYVQMVELEPAEGEDEGRMDIAFNPHGAEEEIYFCLEGKRLNVVKNGQPRPYASEYVKSGMMRFVTGRYAKDVHHGGMAGYVMDGNLPMAIQNVEKNIRSNHLDLGMIPPGELADSSILTIDARARETSHIRKPTKDAFKIHHLFLVRL